MRATIKPTKLLLSLTLALGLAAGCTKKRPDQLAQNQGVDAQRVSDVQSWTHTLNTKASVFTPNKTVAENSVAISEDLADIINNYPLVDYSTDSELLGEDIPLRGKANHSYQLRYELGDSYLRILKVDKKSNIPSEEWAYAVQLEDGLMGVPLVGYRVSYFNIEQALNEDRKRTSTLVETRVSRPEEGEYVRIDRTSRQIFEAIQKVDVYPAKYFEGEWFYQATVVETPAENESAITSARVFDTQLTGAEKVRIKLNNRNTLLGVNVNQDERLAGNELNEGYVFSIPIEWKEFEATKSGRQFGLREQEVQRQSETKRPYIRLKFEEHFSPGDILSFSTLGFLLGQATGDQKLVDVKLAKDYFSFTLLKATQGLKIRYAFRRNLNSTYNDVRAFNERDFETFGYFASAPRIVLTRDFQRKEDIQRLTKMNRFNPEVREIVYHFSKESPSEDNQRSGWAREIGRYAVHFWDQAFQKAGVNIRVRLDESKDVDLGDLRYNVLHIIDPLTYQSLGGFGPSIADPETGEIVSATSNVLLSPYTEGMSRNIRSYILNSLGDQLLRIRNFNKGTDVASLEAVNPLRGMTQFQVNGKGEFSPLSLPIFKNGRVQQVESKLTREQEHLLEIFSKTKNLTGVDQLDNRAKMIRYHDMMHDSYFGGHASALATASMHQNTNLFSNGVSSHLVQRVKRECPAVDQFIAKAKANNGDYQTADEVAVVEECTKKLARLSVLNVFLHEMGHNFSLRHNFKCSADPGPNNSNFWTADDIRREYSGLNGQPFPEEFLPLNGDIKTSCVMDYMPDEHGSLPVPGKYDIAAIRFIYGGKVETIDGRVKPLYSVENGKKQWKSIEEAFGGNKGLLKPLSFCTDLDAMLGSDPLCRLHDIGETPEAVVDHAIHAFWNSLSNSKYSYDRLRAGNLQNSGLARQNIYMVHLKRIYDEWRFYVSKFRGPNRGYLETLDPKSYQAELEKMKNSTYAKEYALYKPARDKIINFFLQVAFLPNRYCLGLTESNQLKAVELSSAIEQVGFYGYEGAIRCQDEGVQKVLKENGIASYVTDLGSSFQNIHFSNNPRALQEVPDVWGTGSDRIGAMVFLGLRLSNSLVHSANGGLFPAMMDEPDVRERVIGLFKNRMLDGVNLTSSLRTIRDFENISSRDGTLRLFKNELPFLNVMSSVIPQSLWIPGRAYESARNASVFSVQRTNNPQQAEAVAAQGGVVHDNGNGIYSYAMPNNVVAYSTLQRLKMTEGELSLQAQGIDEAGIMSAQAAFQHKFPSDGKEMTLFDLFGILQDAGGYLNNKNLHPSVAVVLQQALMPYVQFLASVNGGHFAQAQQSYYQLLMRIAELEQPSAQGLDEEKTAELQKLKTAEGQWEQQLTSVVIGPVLKEQGLASNQSEFQKAIQHGVQELVRLAEQSPDEIRAHQEALNSAISNW